MTRTPETTPKPETVRLAGTSVALEGHAVLLRGPSGSGKSDLALRLIAVGGLLVADDYSDVLRTDNRLVVQAPPTIRGLLEVRGLGIVHVPPAPPSALVAVIDLVGNGPVERFPEPASETLLSITVPLFRLIPFEASAVAKVRLAVGLATGTIILVT